MYDTEMIGRLSLLKNSIFMVSKRNCITPDIDITHGFIPPVYCVFLSLQGDIYDGAARSFPRLHSLHL